jgi:muramoyltetrapeptide carboxypeptidase
VASALRGGSGRPGPEERAAELHLLLEHPDVQAVWCVRGGYGCLPVLPHLDPARIRAACRPLIGYSDVTVLLSFLARHAGVVSFHAPVAVERLPGRSLEDLGRALGLTHDGVLRDLDGLTPIMGGGTATGPLLGGNLTLFVRLMGTPYEPDCEGALLFFEDVNEEPHRIEGMLTQLCLAGKLAAASGLLLGCLRGADAQAGSGLSEPMQAAVRRALWGLRLPVVAGLPSGHGIPQTTLPVGLPARLEVASGRLVFESPAVR